MEEGCFYFGGKGSFVYSLGVMVEDSNVFAIGKGFFYYGVSVTKLYYFFGD